VARPPTSATLLVEFLTRVSRTLEAVLVQLRNTAKRIAALDFCLVVLLVLCHVSSVNAQGSSTNVALASNGGVASASSFYAGFEPSGAIEGVRNFVFVSYAVLLKKGVSYGCRKWHQDGVAG
jgi:hypothetical protein